jgi:hypothetical protein
LRGFFDDPRPLVIWSECRYPMACGVAPEGAAWGTGASPVDLDEWDALHCERMFEACR